MPAEIIQMMYANECSSGKSIPISWKAKPSIPRNTDLGVVTATLTIRTAYGERGEPSPHSLHTSNPEVDCPMTALILRLYTKCCVEVLYAVEKNGGG